MKKYSAFLTVLIIILVISFLGLAGYAIYYYYDNYKADQEAEDIIAEFENNFLQNDATDENVYPETENNEQVTNSTGSTGLSNTSSSYSVGTYYNGYKVIGIISIPKLNIKYPIFDVDNTATLRLGTAAIYPSNAEITLNISGNVVIAGHNYRNSRMFSKIKTLSDGDYIYITNINGTTLEYKVYNNYTASVDDSSYITRDTNGGIEISLSTCTTDASTRTIIWAKAD